MICNKTVRRFCCEDISTIENYDKATTDMKRTWHCHHRLEVGANGETISMNYLKKYGLYYHRPASELIFLTETEHRRIHHSGKVLSEETRRKLSEANKGRQSPNKGKHPSEETRRKRSEALKSYWEKKRMTKE